MLILLTWSNHNIFLIWPQYEGLKTHLLQWIYTQKLKVPIVVTNCSITVTLDIPKVSVMNLLTIMDYFTLFLQEH